MIHDGTVILSKTFKILGDDAVLDLLTKIEPTDSQIYFLYNEFRLWKLYKSLKWLTLKMSVSFDFLGDFYHQSVDRNRFDLLPLPYFGFTIGSNFEQVIKEILNEPVKGGTLRIMGEKTSEYGVNFLNNVYLLKHISDAKKLNLDIQKIFNLDHSLALDETTHGCGILLKFLLKFYTLERSFQLLAESVDMHRLDVTRMSMKIRTKGSLIRLKEYLPKKPKDLREVHDKLNEYLLLHASEEFELEQDILILDGESVDEFTIQVPKTSKDLVLTSLELKHCVHSYGEQVRKKSSQILNLAKGGELQYTVQFFKYRGNWDIAQFKGFRNSDEMEGENGRKIRSSLLSLFAEKGIE